MKLRASFLSPRSFAIAALFALVVVAFLAGVRRQAQSVAALEPLESRVRSLAAERARQLASWEPGSVREVDAQARIRQRCLGAFPAKSEARLRGSAAIASQAERCGLRQVAIEEIQVRQGPGGDEGWDDAAQSSPALRIADDEAKSVLERFDFLMESRCDFKGLLAFLSDLGRDGTVIELRSLVVEGEAPWLKVTMELSVYGREA
jgi:hypothetical protein